VFNVGRRIFFFSNGRSSKAAEGGENEGRLEGRRGGGWGGGGVEAGGEASKPERSVEARGKGGNVVGGSKRAGDGFPVTYNKGEQCTGKLGSRDDRTRFSAIP